MSIRLLVLAALGAALVAACGPSSSVSPAGNQEPVATVEGWETEAIETAGATPVPVSVQVGLPYKPDVQFTPWYVAQSAGHFADEGLDVSFEYGDEASFLRIVAARDMSATVASGEQVVMARSNGIPVTYVATWYDRFPGVVFSNDPSLNRPEALVGTTVGLPAVSGASYLGWQALLAANNIDPDSIDTQVVGFEQLSSVLEGRVDAAVGYAANEPVQLALQGSEPAVIEIADSFNLASNGLVVADTAIYESPTVVQSIVSGFLRGLEQTLGDPEAAFEVALTYVPEAGDPEVREAQRAVLEESLRFWSQARLGAIDAVRWQETQDFLLETGLIDEATPVEEMIDMQFVEAAGAGG
jgi:NitT/TauT family transport system substrate-binding protein